MSNGASNDRELARAIVGVAEQFLARRLDGRALAARLRKIADRAEHDAPEPAPRQQRDDVHEPQWIEVFNFWRERVGYAQAKPTDTRRRKVFARLRNGYTVGDIKDAIVGCAQSEFHSGANGSGRRYDDLELICRNDTKLEQFIALGRARGGAAKERDDGEDLADRMRREREQATKPSEVRQHVGQIMRDLERRSNDASE